MLDARDTPLGLWAESSAAPGGFAGNVPVHIAPTPSLAPEPVRDLLAWYRESDLTPLIKSSVFHSELESIHTFADGNGRMGCCTGSFSDSGGGFSSSFRQMSLF